MWDIVGKDRFGLTSVGSDLLCSGLPPRKWKISAYTKSVFVTGNPADHSPSFLSTRNIFLRPNPVLSSPCQGRYAPLFIEPHTGLGKLNHVTNLVCTRVAASMLWQPLLSSSLKEVPCSEVADTVVPIWAAKSQRFCHRFFPCSAVKLRMVGKIRSTELTDRRGCMWGASVLSVATQAAGAPCLHNQKAASQRLVRGTTWTIVPKLTLPQAEGRRGCHSEQRGSRGNVNVVSIPCLL